LALTTLNEIMDMETDRINKPWKPLPSGEVSVKTAWISVMVFASISISSLFALMARDIFYSIGLIGLLTGLVYNTGRKDIFGNLCLGITYGVSALMVAYPKTIQMIFAFSFATFTVAYNLLVQLQDYYADKTSGIITAPQQLGKWCIPISGALCSLSTIITLWLFLLTLRWFLALFILANITIVASLIRPSKKVIEWSQRRLGRFFITVAFLWMVLTP